MACLNVLSSDNYIDVNITLIKLFGLKAAVYWSELTKVLSKVMKKKKFDENGYFILDRKYITERTTLKEDEQLDCDRIFVTAGIMAVDPENTSRVSVDVKLVLSFIIDGDTDVIVKKAKTIVNKALKKNKQDAKLEKLNGMRATMKRFLTEEDEEVRTHYESWIDTLVGEKKVNRVLVEQFQKDINNYTKDKQVKIKLIDLSAAHLYVDAPWSINLYEKMCVTSPTVLKPQKVGSETEINEGVKF